MGSNKRKTLTNIRDLVFEWFVAQHVNTTYLLSVEMFQFIVD